MTASLTAASRLRRNRQVPSAFFFFVSLWTRASHGMPAPSRSPAVRAGGVVVAEVFPASDAAASGAAGAAGTIAAGGGGTTMVSVPPCAKGAAPPNTRAGSNSVPAGTSAGGGGGGASGWRSGCWTGATGSLPAGSGAGGATTGAGLPIGGGAGCIGLAGWAGRRAAAWISSSVIASVPAMISSTLAASRKLAGVSSLTSMRNCTVISSQGWG